MDFEETIRAEKTRRKARNEVLDEMLDIMIDNLDDGSPEKLAAMLVREQGKISRLVQQLTDPFKTEHMDATDLRAVYESLTEIRTWLERLQERFPDSEDEG